MANFYPFTAISGGGTGAMDALAVAGLSTGDVARVVTSSGSYEYVYNSATTDADDGLFRINPDDNGGNGRWHLVGTSARVSCAVYLTANETITTATLTPIPWDAESFDDGGFWVIGDPTKLSIPVGVTKIRLSYGVGFDTDTTGIREVTIYKNAATEHFTGGVQNRISAASAGQTRLSGYSCPIDVTGGTDYFRLQVYHTKGTDLDVLYTDSTWFAVEAIAFA